MNTNHFVSKSNVTKVIFDVKVLVSNAKDCARLCSHFRLVTRRAVPHEGLRGEARRSERVKDTRVFDIDVMK